MKLFSFKVKYFSIILSAFFMSLIFYSSIKANCLDLFEHSLRSEHKGSIEGRIFLEIDKSNLVDSLETETDFSFSTLKTVEAFTKNILNRSDVEIVDLINRTTGEEFTAADFTGKISLRYFRHGSNKIVYKVGFELREEVKQHITSDGLIEIAIITKKEKEAGFIAQVELDDLKEASGLGLTPRFGMEFEFEGNKYFIEEYIEGPTARELKDLGIFTQQHRALIIENLLEMSVIFGGQIPTDIHEKNFVFSGQGHSLRAVCVDIGRKRVNVDRALLRLIKFYGYFGSSTYEGNNDFIFQEFINQFGYYGIENGFEILNRNIDHVQRMQTQELRHSLQPRAPNQSRQQKRQEQGEESLRQEDIEKIIEDYQAFLAANNNL
ncbi:MAG: hypothetical protein ABIA04_01285 [Pseudomonadota bacterium]